MAGISPNVVPADGRATCHRFFIGNSPACRTEVNTIFREAGLEAIDRTPLYFPEQRQIRDILLRCSTEPAQIIY
jgi:hypothetical protein